MDLTVSLHDEFLKLIDAISDRRATLDLLEAGALRALSIVSSTTGRNARPAA